MTIKPIKTERIRRLLIRSTNWIGDAVMTTPAVRSIRENFPRTHISILAKPWVAPVFENNEHIDAILAYDGNGRHKGYRGKIRLAKELRKNRFDATILLQNAFEAALITFLAGIPIRIGYNTDGRSPLLTHKVFCTPAIKKVHQTRYYLNMLRSIGLKAGAPNLHFIPSRKQRARAEKILSRHGLRDSQDLVGINPSAAFGPAKQWPLERFARLADKIHEYSGRSIIVFGGPDDVKLGRDLTQMMTHPALDLAGKTELGQAMALIDRCSLFVTNDSGLMHVAAALDVPLVAIFGSTNPMTTGPLGSRSKVVQADLPCSPCLKSECPENHLSCMDKIDVDMVFDVAKEVL